MCTTRRCSARVGFGKRFALQVSRRKASAEPVPGVRGLKIRNKHPTYAFDPSRGYWKRTFALGKVNPSLMSRWSLESQDLPIEGR
ncbi:hypothetical protein chiPu_0015089 [Chiloscyllium punctatum]|uniref:Uncharacterized protein n=1 Tax=Chiloscyllium punctatum TaxID=137246 RepID=A0A401T1U7_CHIPU|nr:hypothetical protein [Chiloscyllium punctatum]